MTAPVSDRSRRLEPNVRKIAVLRANGIGDHIFALPALDELRAAYPAAEIVYLGQTWHYPAISRRLRCPRCGAQHPSASCNCAVSFVADVPVDEVLEHALAPYQRANGVAPPVGR